MDATYTVIHDFLVYGMKEEETTLEEVIRIPVCGFAEQLEQQKRAGAERQTDRQTRRGGERADKHRKHLPTVRHNSQQLPEPDLIYHQHQHSILYNSSHSSLTFITVVQPIQDHSISNNTT